MQRRSISCLSFVRFARRCSVTCHENQDLRIARSGLQSKGQKRVLPLTSGERRGRIRVIKHGTERPGFLSLHIGGLCDFGSPCKSGFKMLLQHIFRFFELRNVGIVVRDRRKRRES